MTDEKLRELYRNCDYEELDGELEAQLAEWEYRKIFNPIVSDMRKDGLSDTEIKLFISVCYLDDCMAYTTLKKILKEYGGVKGIYTTTTIDDFRGKDSQFWKYFLVVDEYKGIGGEKK